MIKLKMFTFTVLLFIAGQIVAQTKSVIDNNVPIIAEGQKYEAAIIAMNYDRGGQKAKAEKLSNMMRSEILKTFPEFTNVFNQSAGLLRFLAIGVLYSTTESSQSTQYQIGEVMDNLRQKYGDSVLEKTVKTTIKFIKSAVYTKMSLTIKASDDQYAQAIARASKDKLFEIALIQGLSGKINAEYSRIETMKPTLPVRNPDSTVSKMPGDILISDTLPDLKTADTLIVIPPQFDNAKDFSEGLAAVCIEDRNSACTNAKWGFIDKTGKKVVEFKFDKVKSFSEGLAAVNVGFKDLKSGYRDDACKDKKSKGLWGYINKKGVFVIKPQFEIYEPGNFHDGRAKVKNGFIDSTGKLVFKHNFDWAGDFQNELYS